MQMSTSCVCYSAGVNLSFVTWNNIHACQLAEQGHRRTLKKKSLSDIAIPFKVVNPYGGDSRGQL